MAAHNLMTPARMASRYRDACAPSAISAAWLLHVAIVPRGCGLPQCEDGRVWPTGEPCETCAHNRQMTSEQWRRAREWDERLAEPGRDQVLAKATRTVTSLPAASPAAGGAVTRRQRDRPPPRRRRSTRRLYLCSPARPGRTRPLHPLHQEQPTTRLG
ncbi:hypothetical protein [Streptomyces sp. NPDC047043]|uniref:hypothetical protein n=1 Tax=Streptomyces sp. NPDC047043 TaxID=3154497 RepID=UPI0034040853